ncbi:hypothetical protein LR48_Vigan257s000900 [Vigna angularis]|uniref:Uncharacterized protein n=1 Tax=Phaseolus angularis TaxID=3914 RepID=A0A0L9T717_PHAAN|nr:hypothetical protein LR48_Vigan257s000900 [Vigna angularis]
MCAYWMQQTGRGSVSKAQKKSAPSFTGCSLCASHSPLLDLLLKLECDVAYGCAEAACWTKAACASRSISSTFFSFQQCLQKIIKSKCASFLVHCDSVTACSSISIKALQTTFKSKAKKNLRKWLLHQL